MSEDQKDPEITEYKDPEEQKNDVPEETTKVTFVKKSFFSIVAKIGIGAIAIGIVVFFMLYNNLEGDVVLLLSPQEISSADNAGDTGSFKPNNKMYFFIATKSGKISSDRVILELHYKKKGQFFYYKQISYEIDKNFKKLSSYIPEDYFMRPGSYRIDVYFDNNRKISREFMVEK